MQRKRYVCDNTRNTESKKTVLTRARMSQLIKDKVVNM